MESLINQRLQNNEYLMNLRKSAENFDDNATYNLLMEECSELIKALNKYQRACGNGIPTSKNKSECLNNLAEEVGDVLALIDIVNAKMNLTENIKNIIEIKSHKNVTTLWNNK